MDFIKKPELSINYFATLIFAVVVLSLPAAVHAFGISPPHVINDRLFPNAHYEQIITLSRADAEKEVVCKVEVNTPGFSDWFSFDPSQTFIMPAGEKVAKLNVKVNVPGNAKPGRNRGTIRVTVAPAEQEIGKINIVLGAQIDVDLTVTIEKISDMAVKKVKIPDIEIGWKALSIITIENKGNVNVSPDKVTFDVYDSSYKNFIKSAETDKFSKIKPFEVKDILAFFKIPLDLGQYWGNVKVYKNGEVLWEEKAIFTVREKGTLPPQPKEPLLGIIASNPLILILVVAGAVVLIALAVIVFFYRRAQRKCTSSGN